MANLAEEVVPGPRKRWPRRLLIAANLFVALCVVAAASAYAYLHYQFNRIEKIDFGADILIGEDEDPGDAMNVLMVGSDTRETLTSEADLERHVIDESGNRVTGQRSDTMMVLHVDPRGGKAAILSIPRDLWVTIAGTTTKQRINTAFDKGPERLIQTIRNELGLQIHHYVEVDFVGFRNMVSAVGGVPIYVPAPVRDRYSDLNLPNAGCVTLNGDQALSWVRSRHYQYFEAGRWRSDPTSDFGRIQRQQDFIRRLMKRSISRGIRDPLKLNRMVGIAVKNVRIDSAMSTKDILKLGNRFRSLDPSAVDMFTLPVTSTSVGGAAVLKVKQPDAQGIIDRFNGLGQEEPGEDEKPPEGLLPSAVRVRVLNGTGVGGQAGQVATAMTAFGFNNAGTGDAAKFGIQKTEIHYGADQRGKALLLRSYLKAGAVLKEDRTLQGLDLVLVTGKDYAGMADPAAMPASTTTVPAPSTTAASTGAPAQPQC